MLQIAQAAVEGAHEELALLLKDKTDKDIVFIVGNSLTRIAADCEARYPDGKRRGAAQKDVSWYGLIEELLTDAQMKSGQSGFFRQGYTNPEIVSAAISNARGRNAAKAFARFCDSLDSIRPLELQRALPQLAQVLTTNYDSLLSKSAGELFPEPDPNLNDCRVIHLHGRYASAGAKGLDRVVLTADQYRRVTVPKGALAHGIEALRAHLRSKLVILIGLSLGIEETLIQSLLSVPHGDQCEPGGLIVIEVAEPLAPLFRYALRAGGRDVAMIRGPLGASASPWRRLAFISHTLGLLFDRLGSETAPLKVAARQAYARAHATKPACFQNFARPTEMLRPQVAVFGTVAWNTICGVEASLAQERFYDPITGSLFPEDASDFTNLKAGDRFDVRVSEEMGGQGGATALAMDALGVSTTIVASIAQDEAGWAILDRLAKTEWMNFEGVRQYSSRTSPQMRQSLRSTATVFLDVRQGANATWEHSKSFTTALPYPEAELNDSEVDRPAWAEWYRAIELDGCQAIYLCGSAATDVVAMIADRRKVEPDFARGAIMIMDTGSAGRAMDAQRFVLAEGGIVIASALAALRHSRPALTLRIANYKGCRWRNTGDWYRLWQKRELKDDRGRLAQLYVFLQDFRVRRSDLYPAELATKGGAYIVTLGPYGILGFANINGRIRSYWVIEREAHRRIGETGDWSFLREVRNGLGCGDSARAAFTAVLLANAEGGPVAPLFDDLIDATIAAAYVGALKLQYFRYEHFLIALKAVRDPIYAFRRSGTTARIEVGGVKGAVGSATMSFDIIEDDDAALALAELCVAELRALLGRREPWVKQIEAWRDQVELGRPEPST